MEDYPYFIYPLLQELQNTADPQRSEELRARIAANVGDLETLASITGNPEADLKNFYNDSSPHPSTDDTIDSFIEKFGGGNVTSEAEKIIEESLQEQQPDYFAEMARQKQSASADPLGIPEMIVDPMKKVKRLVKKHDYAAALAIMEEIYLNNPKKSIYFADQIRFVRKLMINESKKSIKS